MPYAGDKHYAVRFEVSGAKDDRLEFRFPAGDAGELTESPALWQARTEASTAITLASTDPTIYPELDRLMGDPDLLGYEDQTRNEGPGWRSWWSSWSCCRSVRTGRWKFTGGIGD